MTAHRPLSKEIGLWSSAQGASLLDAYDATNRRVIENLTSQVRGIYDSGDLSPSGTQYLGAIFSNDPIQRYVSHRAGDATIRTFLGDRNNLMNRERYARELIEEILTDEELDENLALRFGNQPIEVFIRLRVVLWEKYGFLGSVVVH